MRKLLTVTMMLLAGMISVSQAAMPGHNHSGVAMLPAACAKADALASLKCGHAPSAVFDSNGRLWLAWAFGGHVYVNFSDDKGKTYSAPVAVNNTPEPIAARAENRPKVVVDKDGRVFVSWTMKLPKRFSGHIRFSRSVDSGKSFAAPQTVNDHLEVTSHRFESMTVNDRGEIFIAWLDKRDLLASKAKGQDYTGAAVYFAVSIDGGKTFQRNKKIVDHSCECCRTAMAMDNDGLPVILWRHIFGKNTRDHALVKFTGPDQIGEVRRVSFDHWQVDGCPHHGPSLSISDAGVYHLTWFNNAAERHGLFYAYSKDQGQTFSNAISVGNYEAGASHPQVLSVGKKVYLLWKEFDGKQSSLMTMISHDKGQSWSAAKTLLQSSSANDHPLLLRDGEQVYAAWHRRGEDYRLLPLTE